MIRGTIFDLDGTLLDSMPYWNQAGALYLSSVGVQAKPGLAETMLAMTLPEAADYIKAEYGLPYSKLEIANGVNGVMERVYAQEAPLKEGVTGLLEALKQRGVPMAVATVTDRDLVEAALGRLGAAGYFRAVLTTAEVGVGKQEPDIFLRAAERLGSAPGETLVFEDALHALRTAKRAGFRTVGVYDASSAEVQTEIQGISDDYLKDYRDLAALLAALDKDGTLEQKQQ